MPPGKSNPVSQGLGLNLETGCPKMTIVKIFGVLFFKGESNILQVTAINMYQAYYHYKYNILGITCVLR